MQSLDLITGNRTISATSLVPWLFLQEFGIGFNEIRLDLFQPKTIEKLGLYSPSLKVPVLIHKDIKVWDALPICEYISETFLANRGWPSNQKKKAQARSICAELHGDFRHFRQEWPMNCNLNKPSQPDPLLACEIARLDAIIYCSRTKCGDGGPWLFGNFSIADAFMAPYAIALQHHHAQLSQKSREYILSLLLQHHVLTWMDEAQQEIDQELYALAG